MRSTELKKVLNESHFNPRNSEHPLAVAVKIGTPEYWRVKAMELIEESKGWAPGSNEYHESLKEAISLLALSRTYYAIQPEKNTTGTTTTSDGAGG